MIQDDVLNNNTHIEIKTNFKANGKKGEKKQSGNSETTNNVRDNDPSLPFIIPYH